MSTRISDGASFIQRAERRVENIDELQRIPIQVADIRAVHGRTVLSGRVEKIPQSGAVNPFTDQNLTLGHIILDYVHERVPYSHNFLYRMRPETPILMEEHLLMVLDHVREAETDEEKIARSIKFGVGNCSEMTLVGLQCPIIGTTRVERYRIVNGDHKFLVIGRESHTDPNDPSTWNPETVICDPWENTCYPANRMKEFLFDFCGDAIEVKDKKGFDYLMTIIRPYVDALGVERLK